MISTGSIGENGGKSEKIALFYINRLWDRPSEAVLVTTIPIIVETALC